MRSGTSNGACHVRIIAHALSTERAQVLHALKVLWRLPARFVQSVQLDALPAHRMMVLTITNVHHVLPTTRRLVC